MPAVPEAPPQDAPSAVTRRTAEDGSEGEQLSLAGATSPTVPQATSGPSTPTGAAMAGTGVSGSHKTAEEGRAQPPGRRELRAKGRPLPARLRELVWLAAGIVDAFLALDFLFRAIASGPDGFVSVVLRVGGALASPFAGILRPPAASIGHTTYWSAVLAIVVYTIAAWIVARFLTLTFDTRMRAASRPS